MKSKQVIVLRKDLNMRKGKMVAQGAHASMKAILDWGINENDGILIDLPPDTPIQNWIEGSFTKICVSVNSESELNEIYNKAKERGFICSMITDNGLTEFNNIPTKTCCAIGPEWEDDINQITGHLPLL